MRVAYNPQAHDERPDSARTRFQKFNIYGHFLPLPSVLLLWGKLYGANSAVEQQFRDPRLVAKMSWKEGPR